MEQLTQFAPFLLMFVVIYFFMIRPQQKKLKRKKIWKYFKVGDKIITKSGLHGKVSELADTTVVIETMSGKLKWSDLQFLWKWVL
jgi:preprotein translocase subunit YajC